MSSSNRHDRLAIRCLLSWAALSVATLSACTTDLFRGADSLTADVDDDDAGDAGSPTDGGALDDADPPDANGDRDGGDPLPERLELTETVPQDDDENVDPFTDIVLTFNQPVEVGSGAITIVDDALEQTFNTIAVTDERVQLMSDTVVVDLRGVLPYDSTFHVEIDSGAFVGQRKKSFEGINDSTTLNFETVPLGGPGNVSRGLQLWLDADEVRSLELDGGADELDAESASFVQRWLDRSGNENHASASDDAASPRFDSSGLQDHPSVLFDGSDDVLLLAAPFELSSFDVFVVWVPHVAASETARSCVVKHGRTFELNHGHESERRRSAVGSRFEDDTSGWYTSRFAEAAADVPQIHNFLLHGPTRTLEARTMGGGPMPMLADEGGVLPPEAGVEVSSTPLSIGNNTDQDAGLEGAISELIVFSRRLEIAERAALMAYLRGKWGVDHTRCAAGSEMGFVGHDGKCAYARQSTTSWAVGRGRCQAFGEGWDLISPRSELDNSFATGLLLRDSRNRGWIGGSDNAEEGTWIWTLDGEVFWNGGNRENGGEAPEGVFTNWVSSEPSADADADCALMLGTQAPGNGLWIDERCASAAVAICQGPAD